MKIKYFIMRNKNVVCFSIIGMDERFRSAERVFKSENGLLIKSQLCPEITSDTIYLRGAKKNKDAFSPATNLIQRKKLKPTSFVLMKLWKHGAKSGLVGQSLKTVMTLKSM